MRKRKKSQQKEEEDEDEEEEEEGKEEEELKREKKKGGKMTEEEHLMVEQILKREVKEIRRGGEKEKFKTSIKASRQLAEERVKSSPNQRILRSKSQGFTLAIHDIFNL